MMKKTLTILIAIVAIWLTAWQIVQSGDAAGHVDESQIIVAQYEWDGTQHQISLADLETAIREPSGSRKEDYESKADRAEYLEELIIEKMKLLDAIGSRLDKDDGIIFSQSRCASHALSSQMRNGQRRSSGG